MDNFIIEFNDALTPDFCRHLIEKFEQSPHKTAGRTGAGVDKQKKDSLDLGISQSKDWENNCNIISQTILRATIQYVRLYPFIITGAISPTMIDAKTGEPKVITHADVSSLNDEQIGHLIRSIFRLDDVNMQRYTQGQGGYHHWHSEHYPHPKDPEQRSLHRVLLWLIYLNDIEQGGETEFFYQGAKIKPKQGSLILAPCGFTHTHRGSIPISSDKYVLASWIMYQPANVLYLPK